MAFTIAHMAAALPFKRSPRWLHFEALLLGTMLPDLPYFLPHFLNQTGTTAQQSHQWLGVFSYCLPWGLLVFLLWYYFLNPAAKSLFQPWFSAPLLQPPIASYRTLCDITKGNVSSLAIYKPLLLLWLTVVSGIVLGAATHLLWDGITHPSGFIAQQVWWLQYPVNLPLLGDMEVARLLQYLSSLLGLGLLFRFASSRLSTLRTSNLTSNEQSVLALDLNTSSFLIKKNHSLLILSLMTLSALGSSVLAALKWHHLLSTNKYYFLAEVSVSFLQGASGLFIVYVAVHYLIKQVYLR